jgi:SAP domain-containing ribonucleoprotein
MPNQLSRAELLQKHGLPHSGKKDELIERLVKHDEKKMDDLALEEELGNLEEFDEAKLE